VVSVFPAPTLRWVVSPRPDPAVVGLLAAQLGIPPALAALLVQRGQGAEAAARRFLRPAVSDLSDPMALAGMSEAVDAIVATVRAGGTILVHGDYDVDGQCATALLTRALRAAGAHVAGFVPHRLRDGYDFGPAGLVEARRLGVIRHNMFVRFPGQRRRRVPDLMFVSEANRGRIRRTVSKAPPT